MTKVQRLVATYVLFEGLQAEIEGVVDLEDHEDLRLHLEQLEEELREEVNRAAKRPLSEELDGLLEYELGR